MNPVTLLTRLHDNFAGAIDAYRNYIAAGKTFQLAQKLKLHNGEALGLLREHPDLLPEVLRPDVDALIHHYEEWSAKWDTLASSRSFNNEDEFVFANDVTFPKAAAQNLEDYLNKLRQQAEARQRT